MAMKKAEMENHRAAYHDLMAKARLAQQQGLCRNAVELALSTWDHIDGMMQYERKYGGKAFASIESIDMVLKYAPMLLDYHSLDSLEALLSGQRRIEKNTSKSLAGKLAKARALMWDAHRMWNHLEQHPGTRQDELRQVLGGTQDQWCSLAEAWEQMGLIRRTPEGGSYRLTLCTRMGQVVSGKCSSCGAIAEAPKAMFLEELVCPECGARDLFVLLSSESTADRKG